MLASVLFSQTCKHNTTHTGKAAVGCQGRQNTTVLCMVLVASYLHQVNAPHDDSLSGLKLQSGSCEVRIFSMSTFTSSSVALLH